MKNTITPIGGIVVFLKKVNYASPLLSLVTFCNFQSHCRRLHARLRTTMPRRWRVTWRWFRALAGQVSTATTSTATGISPRPLAWRFRSPSLHLTLSEPMTLSTCSTASTRERRYWRSKSPYYSTTTQPLSCNAHTHTCNLCGITFVAIWAQVDCSSVAKQPWPWY